MPSSTTFFRNLTELATYLRSFQNFYTILFAYNGTGKTRLSMEFKNQGKTEDSADTLYFNAFTEDLFSWDNDLENDTERVLQLNPDSRFFEGLQDLEMENRIKPLLRKYADFDFFIDYENWKVKFVREVRIDEATEVLENIKISRGEENLFIWCFFLAVAQLAVDEQESYNWVKYIYIDDPISSLDDNNAIAVAHHLAKLLKGTETDVKTYISTHHALFFNVLCNEFRGSKRFILKKVINGYELKDTTDTPFIYHISFIQELKKAVNEDRLFTYHFSLLRTILEKAANFHGFTKFSDCMQIDDEDEDGELHSRLVNILNHGGYSLFEPLEMVEENKRYFKQIFNNFLTNYKFNEELFAEQSSNTLS
jgi:hypothetical protein